jgi:hypothetical protein
MHDFMRQHGVDSRIVRAALSASAWPPPADETRLKLIIHPGPPDILKEFYENCRFHAEAVYRLDVNEVPSGMIMDWTVNSTLGALSCHLPDGAMWSTKEVRFWTSGAQPLNEFGYLYVGLYIAGNYARYYPDRWLADVEHSSPLALAIEELIAVAEERVPLLALSELTRTCIIPER